MLNMDEGLSVITVKVDELLEALEKNLEKHLSEYQEAEAGFREKALVELEKAVEEVREGKPVRLSIPLAAPTNHAKDYTRVIRMLRMSIDSDVAITEQQFSCYVLDDWAWKGAFVGTNAQYRNSR